MGQATATAPAKIFEIARRIPDAGIHDVIRRLFYHDITLLTAPKLTL
jgi:hypothetical protein